MKPLAAVAPVVVLVLALAACRDETASGSRDPLPTADSHQPQNPSPYGTGAQETRDSEEAEKADSPNDDGKGSDKDTGSRELPRR